MGMFTVHHAVLSLQRNMHIIMKGRAAIRDDLRCEYDKMSTANHYMSKTPKIIPSYTVASKLNISWTTCDSYIYRGNFWSVHLSVDTSSRSVAAML